MQEITDKENLEFLKDQIEKQKRTITQLSEEIKLVNQKLEESEALKSHFISNVSNEIINPFTSIIGLSKNILTVKKEDWKKVITMVALIHSEAFNLDFQLKNIFVAAKIEAGEIAPEINNVEIFRLIEGVIDSFKIEARKKKLSIEVNKKVSLPKGKIFYFKTDAEKIKLILSNLLSNAVKFSYDSGKIEISIEKLNGDVQVSVRDYGTGISEANQKIIFDRFKRLDSGINSLNRGHGLGLSINKAFLDVLNGQIFIESEKGKGSVFTITIPEAMDDASDTALNGDEFLFEDELF